MAKTRILTITSDPALTKFVQASLAASDYDVKAIQETGDELRALIEIECPHLIILDIMMPSLDGIEVCLRIRQWCLVPIVMLSTWGAASGKVRGMNLGAEGYLTEPFGAGDLIKRMGEALQRNLAAAQRLRSTSGPSWER